MKKRLRKRKKIRGKRVVLRCTMDPSDGSWRWMIPAERTEIVYLLEEKLKRTLIDIDDIRARLINPIPLQGITVTVDFDDADLEIMRGRNEVENNR